TVRRRRCLDVAPVPARKSAFARRTGEWRNGPDLRRGTLRPGAVSAQVRRPSAPFGGVVRCAAKHDCAEPVALLIGRMKNRCSKGWFETLQSAFAGAGSRVRL